MVFSIVIVEWFIFGLVFSDTWKVFLKWQMMFGYLFSSLISSNQNVAELGRTCLRWYWELKWERTPTFHNSNSFLKSGSDLLLVLASQWWWFSFYIKQVYIELHICMLNLTIFFENSNSDSAPLKPEEWPTTQLHRSHMNKQPHSVVAAVFLLLHLDQFCLIYFLLKYICI